MIRILTPIKTFKQIDAVCRDLEKGTQQIVHNVTVNGKALDKLK